MKNAIILLSGGIDTATCLALAKSQGYQCYALSFNYGQKHLSELTAAKKLAQQFDVVEHQIVTIPKIQGSALTETTIDVPENTQPTTGITVTYVPARNTIFLSYALAWAELIDADVIFYGANAPDHQGFPDCRQPYIDAFEKMANLATKKGVEHRPIQIVAPLVNLSKADIIQLGTKLGVNYAQTITCYQADSQGRACGKCDSCRMRQQGFNAANLVDPTTYV